MDRGSGVELLGGVRIRSTLRFDLFLGCKCGVVDTHIVISPQFTLGMGANV